MLVFPIKWLGPAFGFTVFGEDALTWRFEEGKGWAFNASFSAAAIAAIILGSMLMVIWKEIAARRAERRG